MNITDIKIRKVENKNPGSKLLAYVTVTFDDCLVLHNIRVIRGQKGIFIVMPNRRTKIGEYKDIVHPINQNFREILQTAIFKEYVKENPSNLVLELG
ncbi:septation regulator SpoVG [Borrelia miyamotoi]|uniref:Putative septation protein SpoVG n=1 Tax=Borrelia miyamotoi TaxID=47466 RepID=A0AAQ3AG00_9SPIR|nr:septation regulator SpoVG [Borrelia miyamotoi]AGT27727.1 SpoVG-like regulatory protein [Borrelia miyamotoi LB-2001]AJA58876.1 regulatory protein SpoVG [Borrelia miyamotoi]AOW95967.1 septation protein SpoVG [Borrelia miyamotoi]QTL83861.1 septation regulator SpoVG [Borrelia miyamotoi]WAZ84833.1 septation regulator SpoVG [Borrelia miyamotoi]